MDKLIKWLKWLDDNWVHFFLILFIFATALVPKYPFSFVEYTYIRIRYDDFLPLIIGIVFFIQWIRRKIKLNTAFLILFILFWLSVFTSLFIGFYVQNTIPQISIGLLHSLRRIQYMLIFFIASSAVITDKRFFQYLNYYLWALLGVCIYGLGQRFLGFPSIQSMNPAYVNGRLLVLKPEDRINSTFGGHFDLAAYLTFSMPLILGFYIWKNQKRYLALFVFALIILLYTAARSSFIAYIATITLFLLIIRRFKLLGFVILTTAILMFFTGDMTKRFLQTVQIKTVYVNEQTGQEKIDQKISTKNLPAGNLQIPIAQGLIGKDNSVDLEKLRQLALEQAMQEAQKSGRKMNTQEIQSRANEIAKFIKPQRTVLCDISCAVRLVVEWPRAIAAFSFNPVFGSGPSSITEATDNDYLRWLGETGLVGTGIFIIILVAIARLIYRAAKKTAPGERLIFYGFIFGLLALLINGLYIDVFEGSKIAYNFWLVAGLFIGFSTFLLRKNEKRQK